MSLKGKVPYREKKKKKKAKQTNKKVANELGG